MFNSEVARSLLCNIIITNEFTKPRRQYVLMLQEVLDINCNLRVFGVVYLRIDSEPSFVDRSLRRMGHRTLTQSIEQYTEQFAHSVQRNEVVNKSAGAKQLHCNGIQERATVVSQCPIHW